MKTIFLTLALAFCYSNSSLAINEGEKPKTIQAINSWVKGNISYPQDAIRNQEQGTVYVAFSIEEGKIAQIEVVSGVSQSLDEEVLKTLKTIPMAEFELDEDGNASYILPVNFSLK